MYVEFRQTREKHDFFTICRTPELACEVTLQVCTCLLSVKIETKEEDGQCIKKELRSEH